MQQQPQQQVAYHSPGGMLLQPRPQPLPQHYPPPYRAPPTPLHKTSAAYSHFNVSEPNMMQYASRQPPPMTAAHPNRTMLTPASQQRLQSMQNRLPLPGDTYVSPDSLRDAANRMFSRNQGERASVGGNVGMMVPPQHHSHINGHAEAPSAAPTKSVQFQLDEPQNSAAKYNSLPTNNKAETPQRSIRNILSSHFGGGKSSKSQSSPQDEAGKRHAFDNTSFRKAVVSQQQPQTDSADPNRAPPQVPPKPTATARHIKDEVDNLDLELKLILNGEGVSGGAETPPLPALSLTPRPSPDPARHARPDLLDTSRTRAQNPADLRRFQDELASLGGITADLESVFELQHQRGEQNAHDATSDESTTLDMTDAAMIRKQLDGLEGMYSEVLKLLGLRKFGRAPVGPGGPSRDGTAAGATSGLLGADGRRKKLYGSLSSLPSVSSIGSRHLYGKDQQRRAGLASASVSAAAKRSTTSREKSVAKRFQRLESHVVTLARSVAHLSSEIRNQQLLIQEVEALRLEVHQMRVTGHFHEGTAQPQAGGDGPRRVSNVHANRVRKLQKFFGDDPPLLRIFLKNLGYEKFASALEEAKIGLLELPYVNEEALERLGIPMGPRTRIVQEARLKLAAAVANDEALLRHQQHQHQHQQMALRQSHQGEFNVYIL
jgi:predicted DNA-binding protein (UPF0251 family)